MSDQVFICRVGESRIIIETPPQIVKDINSDRFLKILLDACGKPHIKHVGIDFLATNYIDSGAITALLTALAKADETGVTISIIAPAEDVLEVLIATGLEGVFEIFKHEAEYLNYCEDSKGKSL
ncbi:MAG: hypothetical protein A2268_13570 [Candidatus Raymondbacteria bacterium RifOxyA12_full_50_37]|uniref:STAS domain-containing protein n=1 Tax=Candidatus Raymondbacteria bacterium RIFOXYD12_FULL_49_13 TaxID=1817890 RepID=A0A1F7F8K5_UNCRA|nr:MAG: hypothetical protein A2350_08220 [Candidatus Raymondbacteria bacterium RifOxyB12_full_50_8]OGJ90416.1 MAG: hypothetical protein A2268_13570 [Candidatus Raymondbacteria bacterium RifOxyA12_full_50_37]OGJ91502.1 MAG: hypothetical protein A2248_03625 [Candidatus Raymondbacteria bacterium RIFOXYA2_FULL_49_16]OGJ97816.1 MAG: hypothetical protein A2453_14010 [Candidatus Raymondbacteria bacterium RIFOXYC2_FULL_50_21]OGK02102.1 MAG: hypothetical protein A2487_20860 [Candidatus Raymondbacteria b